MELSATVCGGVQGVDGVGGVSMCGVSSPSAPSVGLCPLSVKIGRGFGTMRLMCGLMPGDLRLMWGHFRSCKRSNGKIYEFQEEVNDLPQKCT